jgi:putative membrane protein (TIGR04086 family)
MKKGKSRKGRCPSARERRGETTGIRALLFSSLIGAAVGIGALLILVLTLSAVCLCFDEPHGLVTPLCFFCVLSSAFFAGFTAQKRLRCKALLGGAMCGIMLALALWIFSALLRIGFDTAHGSSYLLKILVIPLSCVGSAIGTSSLQKRRGRQKRK